MKPEHLSSLETESKMLKIDSIVQIKYLNVWALVVCTTFISLAFGCSTPPPPSAPNPSTVRGDWDDCLAAADYAMTAGECAIISTRTQTDRTLVLNIRSVADDPGTLTFTKAQALPADAGKAGEPIVVEAFLGIAGSRDTTREQRLVAAVIKRLRALQGVDWAPTDD